jgi:hypothetical protein
MFATRWRRRDFLLTTALGALAIAAGGRGAFAAPEGALDPDAARVLRRVARLLYPHPTIPDQVYAEVADGVIGGADPTMVSLLKDGAAALAKTGRGGWLATGESDQIAALKRIENSPFFKTFKAAVQARLYEHPAMWAHIDYPGPSLPFGGYVEKGFDDIDWLPKA